MADRPKTKGSETIGTKTIIGEMAALHSKLTLVCRNPFVKHAPGILMILCQITSTALFVLSSFKDSRAFIQLRYCLLRIPVTRVNLLSQTKLEDRKCILVCLYSLLKPKG